MLNNIAKYVNFFYRSLLVTNRKHKNLSDVLTAAGLGEIAQQEFEDTTGFPAEADIAHFATFMNTLSNHAELKVAAGFTKSYNAILLWNYVYPLNDG